jgi:AraC family transcriptional regulator
MSLTNRALWIIDRNLERDLSLGDIAVACSVSRHHLAHAFGETVGMTVMDYVRGRRLSEAAERLAAGANDILQLALASSYGSHEAFSRAFRAKFDATPEAVRRCGTTEGLVLTQPIQLNERDCLAVGAPVLREAASMLAVGLSERRAFGDVKAITALWRRFGPEVGAISNKAHVSPVGILTQAGEDGGYDYACAVLVRNFSAVPSHLARLRLPAQRYAIFRHASHVSTIGKAYEAILNDWLPGAGLTLADGPSLEWHASGFDPMTGEVGLEIWLPVVG